MPAVPYERHFNLCSAPFSAYPDPHWLYPSTQHREAIAHVLYGLNGAGGFVLLTGSAGTGKTVVCRHVLSDLPDDVDVACVESHAPDVGALVLGACRSFGLDVPSDANVKWLVDRLNDFLRVNYERGRRSVLMLDEAHRLGPDVLEQLRLLTNLETNERKLLQILLVGRPPIEDLLERSGMRQIAQRIVARCRLEPFRREDVWHYVQHRLKVSGGSPGILPISLAPTLYKLSGGVPRTINLLCDRALLDASLADMPRLEVDHLKHAAVELGLREADPPRWAEPSIALAATILVAACGASVVLAGHDYIGPTSLLGVPTAVAAGATRSGLNGTEAGSHVQEAEEVRSPLHVASAPQTLGVSERSAQWAQHALLRRWGVDTGSSADPCKQRVELLVCLRGQGGLLELSAINLPAVLHLEDANGWREDVLLLGIEGGTVRIGTEEGERRINRRSLAATWRGRYTLLWRSPPGFRHPPRDGSRGAAVDWLQTSLASWRGSTGAVAGGAVFDSALRDLVREFQMSERLVPDGIPGKWTMMRLAMRTDSSTPRLSPGQNAGPP